MLAFITGASAGIGEAMARELSRRGYDLILTARRTERLEQLKKELGGNIELLPADLSQKDEVLRVLSILEDKKIDIAINNAGFGLCAPFCESDLERETEMISVNVTAVHIFTKFFVKKFKQQGNGRLLNVASAAAFLPGPYMSTYYATKAYVFRLSQSVSEELRRAKSKAHVSVLCPGPVKTEFDSVAKIDFGLAGKSSESVAKYAVKKLLSGKRVIIPGIGFKVGRVFTKLLPDFLLANLAAVVQNYKMRG